MIALFIVACANTTLTAPGNPTPLAQPAKPGSVNVHITLVEFRILSSLKLFHAGTTYYFIVSNHGQQIHEFKIMPDKPDGTPLSPDLQYKDTLIELEPIMPGTTWSVNYTFSTSGRFELACQMGRHYMAGMRLPIVVAS